MPPDDIQSIIEKLDRIGTKIDDLQDRMARTETMIETEALRCPHRETISKAANNIRRLEEVEDKVQRVQIELASRAWLSGGIGGAIISGIVGLVQHFS